MFQNANKDLFLVLIGRGLQVVIGLISLRALTTMLGGEQLGYYYLIMAIASWFTLVMIGPIGVYFNRKTNQWYENGQLTKMYGRLILYAFCLASASIFIVATLNQFLHFRQSESSLLLGLIVASQVSFASMGQGILGAFNLTTSRQLYVLVAVVSQFLTLAFSVVLAKVFGGTAYMWLIGIALGGVVNMGICLWYFRRRASAQAKTSGAQMDWRELRVFVAPVLVAALLTWAQSQGYRLFLESWLGLEALGRLSVGLGVASSIFVSLEGFVTQYFYPALYRVMDDPSADSKQQSWRQIGNSILLTYFLVFLGCAFAAPQILHVLVAPAYHDLANVFTFGLLVECSRVMTNVANLVMHSEWRPRRSLLPYTIGVLVIWIGGGVQHWLGDQNMILFAAIVAFAGVITFLMMWREGRKLIHLQWPWKESAKILFMMAPILLLRFLPMHSMVWNLVSAALAGGWTGLLLLRQQARLA